MRHIDVKPGDRVAVVNPEAQNIIGGTSGIVVGDTAASPQASVEGPKLVVAIDNGPATNAVVDPADLEPLHDH